MTEQFFEDVLGVPEPSTVDVSAIIRRERRRSVGRRAAVSVAAAAMALAAGVVAPHMVNRALPAVLPSVSPSASASSSASPTARASATPSPSTRPSRSAAPPPGSTFPVRADAATADALNGVVSTLLDDISAGSVVRPNAGQDVPITCHPAIDGAQCGEIGTLTRDGRHGFFELEVVAPTNPCTSPGYPTGCTPPPPVTTQASCAEWGGAHCAERTDAHGWHIVSVWFQGGLPGEVQLNVRVRTPTGVWLMLEVLNSIGAGAVAIAQPEPPLSLNELTDLGLKVLARIRT